MMNSDTKNRLKELLSGAGNTKNRWDQYVDKLVVLDSTLQKDYFHIYSCTEILSRQNISQLIRTNTLNDLKNHKTVFLNTITELQTELQTGIQLKNEIETQMKNAQNKCNVIENIFTGFLSFLNSVIPKWEGWLFFYNYFCEVISETSPVSSKIRYQLASKVISKNTAPSMEIAAPLNSLVLLGGDLNEAKKVLKKSRS